MTLRCRSSGRTCRSSPGRWRDRRRSRRTR
jgi:hypothetical protein